MPCESSQFGDGISAQRQQDSLDRRLVPFQYGPLRLHRPLRDWSPVFKVFDSRPRSAIELRKMIGSSCGDETPGCIMKHRNEEDGQDQLSVESIKREESVESNWCDTNRDQQECELMADEILADIKREIVATKRNEEAVVRLEFAGANSIECKAIALIKDAETTYVRHFFCPFRLGCH